MSGRPPHVGASEGCTATRYLTGMSVRRQVAPTPLRSSIYCRPGDRTRRTRASACFRRERGQFPQSTATSSAAHTCPIRSPLSRPSRSTSTPIETLSTESRFTADRRGTGSSPGSRATSLGRPRTVVVQGAIKTRRSLGIAASRDRTTTGRRPISGSSHHHTSPRAGRAVMTRPQRRETTQGRPTHQAHRGGVRRTRRKQHRLRSHGDGQVRLLARHPAAPHRSSPTADCVHSPKGSHQRWYSPSLVTCHHYATNMLHTRFEARSLTRRRTGVNSSPLVRTGPNSAASELKVMKKTHEWP